MIAVDMRETDHMAELFREFVAVVCDDSQARAAEALRVDKSTVSRICAGSRRVSASLALRIEEASEGRYRKEAFIWPEPGQGNA
jgi:plasmid maintenance system antidote protein VapI